MSGDLAALLERLRGERLLGPETAATFRLPPQPARLGELPEGLPIAIVEGLAQSGISGLWSHQVEGLEALAAGRDLLLTTPTASGKSLVFHLPPLVEAAREGPGRALFLYPLKALGHDQLGKVEALARACGLPRQAEVYDGDTGPRTRQRVRREPPRVLISNPDMVHLSLLGNWPDWVPFLRELRWIVLDELHTYRGIFGSHFHHVLARLLRICRAEGAEPRLIASSATAANAGEFARRLTGRPFHWIRESGAPREVRHLLLMRPQGSPYTTALRLLAFLLEAGLKTIVFTKARRITELLCTWFEQQRPDLARRIASYRSGFLPEERRAIEARLAEGALEGVISTSALESGIDIGGLDACVLVGYPGSVMATWQRSGRAGRSGRESVTALVPLPDALDQYLVDHPETLLERPCEELVVDPANAPVARGHLVCAAAERPLDPRADAGYLEPFALRLEELEADGKLRRAGDGRWRARVGRPHRQVGLRGAGRTVLILESGSGRLIGTVDGVRVLFECHPGAIYLHRGGQYLVRQLDLGARTVHAEPVRVDYFTTPQTEKETEILELLDELSAGPLRAGLGRLRVTERVVGFERKSLQGQETLDVFELDLPPVSFETVGLWWLAPTPVEEALKVSGRHFMGALHAAEHAAISLVPLLAVCDRGDLGGISQPRHPQLPCGGIFVYDGHAGGVGISARTFRLLPELLERVVSLLEACPCEEGCPACVQSPRCGNGNRPLDKSGAKELLDLLLRSRSGSVWVPEAPGQVLVGGDDR